MLQRITINRPNVIYI
jgi:hypothetical protein